MKQSDWIPVEERIPDTARRVAIWGEQYGEPTVGRHYGWGWSKSMKPTHWAELTPLPTAEVEPLEDETEDPRKYNWLCFLLWGVTFAIIGFPCFCAGPGYEWLIHIGLICGPAAGILIAQAIVEFGKDGRSFPCERGREGDRMDVCSSPSNQTQKKGQP